MFLGLLVWVVSSVVLVIMCVCKGSRLWKMFESVVMILICGCLSLVSGMSLVLVR